jgi:hypothetical protein
VSFVAEVFCFIRYRYGLRGSLRIPWRAPHKEGGQGIPKSALSRASTRFYEIVQGVLAAKNGHEKPLFHPYRKSGWD